MNLITLYKKLTNRKHTIRNKLIISIFIWFFWILNFCLSSREYLWVTWPYWSSSTSKQYDVSNFINEPWKYLITFGWDLQYCWAFNECFYMFQYRYNWWYMESINAIEWVTEYEIDVNENQINNWEIRVRWRFASTQVIISKYFESSTCPEINTWEILSWYILESDIDINYCVGNWLCPNECWSGEELTWTNRSSLFINNIQYNWAPTIKVTIPEEIQRDENTDEEETNIDIIWYWYDQDKMQQMVNTQYYKPTAEEMSWLMEKVADFLPLVAVALLIMRIWRIIKKTF